MNQKGRMYAVVVILVAAFVWTSYQVKRSEMGSVRSEAKVSVSSSTNRLTKRMAPDFTLTSLDGDKVSLAEFRGKDIVLLAFSATSFPMCRATMPRLSEWDQKYGGKGLRVITVNYGEDASMVSQFVKKTGYKPLVLLDDGSVRAKYHVVAMPTIVLVDKAGKVTSVRVGQQGDQYRWIEAEICKLLGLELAPAATTKRGGFVHERH